MKPMDEQMAAFLLARIEWQLERISETQHALARRKALLREQATRIRLGASPADLRVTESRVLDRATFRHHVPRALS